MNEVIQIPPKIRAWLYYILGVANVAFISAQATKLGDGTTAAVWIDFGQQFTAGASALLLGMAGANVISRKLVATRGITREINENTD